MPVRVKGVLVADPHWVRAQCWILGINFPVSSFII